jgi:hypothetical protein
MRATDAAPLDVADRAHAQSRPFGKFLLCQAGRHAPTSYQLPEPFAHTRGSAHLTCRCVHEEKFFARTVGNWITAPFRSEQQAGASGQVREVPLRQMTQGNWRFAF